MSSQLDPLILDLVEWVAKEPRSYDDVLEAWRTSCPRLTVWEDAVERGYVARIPVPGTRGLVQVTPQGLAFLCGHGRGGEPDRDRHAARHHVA
ncbi:MAG: hypothetical protein KIT16_06190 [Rhodospirillaceae bacterium]|nr:hypothetical protein [Rhodospirillaceae bacterium]